MGFFVTVFIGLKIMASGDPAAFILGPALIIGGAIMS